MARRERRPRAPRPQTVRHRVVGPAEDAARGAARPRRARGSRSTSSPTGPGTPPLRLLGWVDAHAGRARRASTRGPGRIPAAVLAAGARRLDATRWRPTTSRWFAREGDAVRLHVSALYTHAYDDEDGDTAVVIRAFDASVPLTAPEGSGSTRAATSSTASPSPALPAFPIAGLAGGGPFEVRARPRRRPGPAPVAAPDAGPSTAPRRARGARRPRRRRSRPAAPDPWLVLGTFSWRGRVPLVAGAAPARAPASAARRDRRGRARAEDAPHRDARATSRSRCAASARRTEYRDTLAATLEEVKGLQNVIGSVLLLTRGAETPLAREPVDVVALVKAEAERLHASRPTARCRSRACGGRGPWSATRRSWRAPSATSSTTRTCTPWPAARSACASRSSAPRCSSPSRTTGPASRPRAARRCSSGSGAGPRWVSGASPARGSACRSRAGSPRSTAARSPSTPPSRAARGSCSVSLWAPRRRPPVSASTADNGVGALCLGVDGETTRAEAVVLGRGPTRNGTARPGGRRASRSARRDRARARARSRRRPRSTNTSTSAIRSPTRRSNTSSDSPYQSPGSPR